MTQKTTSIARCALTIIMTALSFASGAVAAGSYMTVSPGDDLQRAIDTGSGTLRFSAGVYLLNGPLKLKSNRTYVGEGSWDTHHGSVLIQQMPGAPVFMVGCPAGTNPCTDETVDSVNIIG